MARLLKGGRIRDGFAISLSVGLDDRVGPVCQMKVRQKEQQLHGPGCRRVEEEQAIPWA